MLWPPLCNPTVKKPTRFQARFGVIQFTPFFPVVNYPALQTLFWGAIEQF